MAMLATEISGDLAGVAEDEVLAADGLLLGMGWESFLPKAAEAWAN